MLRLMKSTLTNWNLSSRNLGIGSNTTKNEHCELQIRSVRYFNIVYHLSISELGNLGSLTEQNSGGKQIQPSMFNHVQPNWDSTTKPYVAILLTKFEIYPEFKQPTLGFEHDSTKQNCCLDYGNSNAANVPGHHENIWKMGILMICIDDFTQLTSSKSIKSDFASESCIHKKPKCSMVLEYLPTFALVQNHPVM